MQKAGMKQTAIEIDALEVDGIIYDKLFFEYVSHALMAASGNYKLPDDDKKYKIILNNYDALGRKGQKVRLRPYQAVVLRYRSGFIREEIL